MAGVYGRGSRILNTYMLSGTIANAAGFLAYNVLSHIFPTTHQNLLPSTIGWIVLTLIVLVVFSLVFGLIHVPLMLLLHKIKPDRMSVILESMLSGGIVGIITFIFVS